MEKQPVSEPLQPIIGPRIPQNIDAIVEEVARLEWRKKNAIVVLAVAQYVASHHPELLDKHKGVVA